MNQRYTLDEIRSQLTTNPKWFSMEAPINVIITSRNYFPEWDIDYLSLNPGLTWEHILNQTRLNISQKPYNWKILLLRKKFASDLDNIWKYLEEITDVRRSIITKILRNLVYYDLYSCTDTVEDVRKYKSIFDKDLINMSKKQGLYDIANFLGIYSRTEIERRAIFIQRTWRKRRREKAALKIQRACRNWISKPITADGKYGIDMRLGMKRFHKMTITPLHPEK